MKRGFYESKVVLAVAFLLFNSPTFSQSDFICGIASTETPTEFKGMYLPELGEIRALVVYAQFPDDNTSSSAWPSGQLPPGYAGIIASTNSASYPSWTLSDYFREMSNGTQTTGLNLIGDVYNELVMVPDLMSNYIGAGKNYGHVNRDVIAWLDANTNMNFADYDKWQFNSSYNHTNTPDGKVDMIIVIYRFMDVQLKSSYGDFSGIAQLGHGSVTNLTTYGENPAESAGGGR